MKEKEQKEFLSLCCDVRTAQKYVLQGFGTKSLWLTGNRKHLDAIKRRNKAEEVALKYFRDNLHDWGNR